MALSAPLNYRLAPPVAQLVANRSPKVRVLLVSADPSEFSLIRGLLDDIAPHNFALEQIKLFDAALDSISSSS